MANGRKRHSSDVVGDDRTVGFYCRGCGYALRNLESARCPECGREFDPAQPKTMSTSPRSAKLRMVARAGGILFTAAVLTSYVAGYLKLVTSTPPVKAPIHVVAGEHGVSTLEKGADNRLSPLCRELPGVATYRAGGAWTPVLFITANWIDRQLRKDLWTFYDLGEWECIRQEFNPACKTLLAAIGSPRRDQQFIELRFKLWDTILAAHGYKAGTAGFKREAAKVWSLEAALKQAMQGSPSTSPVAR